MLTRGSLVVYSDRMIVSFGAQSNGAEDHKEKEVSAKKKPGNGGQPGGEQDRSNRAGENRTRQRQCYL